MAHVTLGAGLFATIGYTSAAITHTETLLEAATYTDITDIREFPTFGTPANIINVPEYGTRISKQVSGQADAPTIEITLNYTGAEHTALQTLITADAVHTFRFTVQNSDGTTPLNTSMYVDGKFASVSVTPNLTDSNTMVLTIATATDYVGPFTV